MPIVAQLWGILQTNGQMLFIGQKGGIMQYTYTAYGQFNMTAKSKLGTIVSIPYKMTGEGLKDLPIEAIHSLLSFYNQGIALIHEDIRRRAKDGSAT